jgi:hypothetical protein
MRAMKLLACFVGFAAFSLPAIAAAPVGDELFAANLGIFYERIPYADGTFGARLTRNPAADSPAAQIGLETGDIVFMMDDLRFREPADVLNHVDRTTVALIEVRTNQVKSAVVILPGQGPGLNPTVHTRGPAGNAKPGTISQPELQRVVSEELRGGHVEFKPPRFRIEGDVVHWTLGGPDFNFLNTSAAVSAQFQVEIIRMTRRDPPQRAFWEPYLQRVEAVIAELLAKGPALGREPRPLDDDDGPEPKDAPKREEKDDDDAPMMGDQDERIARIFEEAMQANAAAMGRRAQQEPPVAERGIYQVRLTTRSGGGRIFIMPRTSYRIRAFRPVALTDFQSLAAGSVATLTGEYVYMIRDSAEAFFLQPHTPLPTFRADRSGRIELQ